MRSLANLRIGTRLGLSFATVLLLMVAMAAAGVLQLRRIATLDTQSDQMAKRYALVERWQGATTQNLIRALTIGRSGYHDATVKYLEPQMQATTARITELHKTLDELIGDGEQRKLFDAVSAKRKVYVDLRGQGAAAFKAGQADQGATMFNGPVTAAAEAYLASIEELQLATKTASEALGAEAAQRGQQAQTLLLLLGALALVVGGGLAFAMTRSVTKPLESAITAAERIAAQDLSQPVPGEARGDEIGTLLRALRAMQTSLTGVVLEIRSGTVNVAGASKEIADAGIDLSARTEQAAGSLQQTASAMEQITATVGQTADSARTANQLAVSAGEVAQRGGSVFAEVVSTMEQINDSSRQIADIVGTIDGIAFQTNILALNAAVEAARAGEQGRGFAVVAGEVRILAQRSAEAAKQIKSLIGASVERVASGSRLVGNAGGTMTEIVASVQRVGDIIGEVMAAAGEQSHGVSQVNGSVAQLDQMTQQNAALVEETAAASASLREQSEKLAALVATFRLAAA